jgi:hypothetical protein
MTREYAPNEKEEIRGKFLGWGARRVTFMDLMKHDEEVEIEEEVAEAIKIDELFRKFMEADSRGTKGLRPNLLLRLDREIREKGDQLYAEQLNS